MGKRNLSSGGDSNNLNTINRAFYKKLVIVGIPMVLQQVIAVTLNLADTIMVGKVGENALAAVGAANQVYFIFSVVVFGVFSGAAVHAVQYWGIRDLASLRKIIGIDYTVCVALAVPVMIFVFFTAPFLISLFAEEPEVIELGTKYLRIAVFSYLFSGLSFVISYNSRSIQDVIVPTIINGGAILLNVIGNYLLIYGKFGFPELGVEGAAIATLIARVVECIAMHLSVYLRKEYPLKATLGELLSYSKELFTNVMRTAIPVILTEGLWAVSVSCIFAAYGKIGAAAFAVSQVAMTVTDFFQTIYFGLGNASAVLLGEVLGQGKKKLTYQYSKNILKVTWLLNVVMTVVIILARGPIADIYDFEPETTTMLMKALLVYAIAMTPKMLAYMMICSIFRPGGDTVFCMFLDVGFNIGMQVPLAFISVMVFKLPLHWAMTVVAIADVIKVFVCYYRYYSKKWMNVFTGRSEEEEEL